MHECPGLALCSSTEIVLFPQASFCCSGLNPLLSAWPAQQDKNDTEKMTEVCANALSRDIASLEKVLCCVFLGPAPACLCYLQTGRTRRCLEHKWTLPERPGQLKVEEWTSNVMNVQ